ncbi:hypothetical protein I317_01098 [Kwoniella heveanensis CBS 569]|nr:hypothetical protein I317_01098 [Kwoniella heveanensis CBS 569]
MSRSRSTTPGPTGGRSSTPLSAPPTPVTPTHLLPAAMERARSSEAVLGAGPNLAKTLIAEREGRRREVKDTSLKREWENVDGYFPAPEIQSDEEEDKMDIDGEESGPSTTQSPRSGTDQLNHPETEHEHKQTVALGEPIESSDQEVAVHLPTPPEEGKPYIWGMPKWGCETERREVRKGVKLVGMEELPALVDRHSMLDTPSSVMFPWLHGISDDGQKGRDMAAFFGHAPPFEPPPYRGLCLLFCPPHPLDEPRHPHRPKMPRADTDQTTQQPSYEMPPPRERSETMSTSSESYHSSGTTEATSPSIAGYSPLSSPGMDKLMPELETEEPHNEETEDVDVAMHPCDSKRVSPVAIASGLDEPHHPMPCAETSKIGSPIEEEVDSSDDSSEVDSEDQRPTCILYNALHVTDVFDLPKHGDTLKSPRFRQAKLPHQINLRNLNIQQIKYGTVSDIILYSKTGVGNGILEVAEQIARAQDELWQIRMDEFYRHVGGSRPKGEGSSEPVKYGVWVVVEPFSKVEKHCPHLVNITSKGENNHEAFHTDLFEREARESRAMTRGSEVVEGLWVGNDCDVPGGADDGAGAEVPFDLCLRASECADMPSPAGLVKAYQHLLQLDRRRRTVEERSSSWTASPATIALRNLLSPSPTSPTTSDVPSKRLGSPTPNDRKLRSRSEAPVADHEYVQLECSGSCRTITGQIRNPIYMTDKVVELVYFLRKLVEGRDKSGIKRRVLIHCQDGYTESSIIVLSYIMSSLSCSLSEAFLHLQLVAKRSFFLYPSDKPLLRRVDLKLAADRRAKAVKLVSNTAPHSSQPTESTGNGKSSPRWRGWGIPFSGSGSSPTSAKGPATITTSTVDVAKEMLAEQDNGGSKVALESKVWFEDRRFDGFPSRILPFLYLGNLEHADNAAMLKALGISHVVSVGESLVSVPEHENHSTTPGNSLCAHARAGQISVLDLTDVRDDGNDPLRPVIARACAWIEQARRDGGTVLVHCRVGVSRSASIVIAYLMQFERMGLMDAYMMCRARRLNVLIQPNLRFFHELFGWEVELARQEEETSRQQGTTAATAEDTEQQGRGRSPQALKLTIDGSDHRQQIERRRIVYSWPSFCRDLHCLNRRFLCN